jgi:hypothetical protein
VTELGIVAGVTAEDGRDVIPSPPTFIAVTLNVYAVPFVSPVTVQLSISGDVTS